MNHLTFPTYIGRDPSVLPPSAPSLLQQQPHSAGVSPSTSTSPRLKLSLSPSKSSLVGQSRLSQDHTGRSTSTSKSLSFHPIEPNSSKAAVKVTHHASKHCTFSSSLPQSAPPSPFSILSQQSYPPHPRALSETESFFDEIFNGYSSSSSTLDLPRPMPKPMTPVHSSSSTTSSAPIVQVQQIKPEIKALNKKLSGLIQILEQSPESTIDLISLSNTLNEYLCFDRGASHTIDRKKVALLLHELVLRLLKPAKSDLEMGPRGFHFATAKAVIENFEKKALPPSGENFFSGLKLDLEAGFRQHFATILKIPVEALSDFGLITFADFETIGLYQIPLAKEISDTKFIEQIQILRNLIEEIQKPLFHSDFDPLSKTCSSRSKRQFDRVHAHFNYTRFLKTKAIITTINSCLSMPSFENLQIAKYTLAKHYLDQNRHVVQKIHQLHGCINLSELLRASSQLFIADIFAFHNMHILLAGDRGLTSQPVSLPHFDEELFEFYGGLPSSTAKSNLDEQPPMIKRPRKS